MLIGMRIATLVFFLLLTSTSNTMGKTETELQLHYTSPQDNVTIVGPAITWISTEFVFDNPVSAVPSASRTITRTGQLVAEQVTALEHLITETDFFNLKDAYGAPDNERFYGYDLTVTLAGRTKSVSFHSNPAFGSAPSGFSKIERFLIKIKPRD